ncbi:MAG: Tn7 transposase TnsA N-terminal domain-containing protein [Sulfurospirillum sp.]|nr:Tn7 transposase TnsA N-terminal domain-containing protein [Sulfurospirillum sp.]
MTNIQNSIPKRKLKKTFRSVTGYFPSIKNDRSMAFESLLEKQLFLSLEFDDTVDSYLEQPVKIEYFVQGRKRSYHPDCLVSYKKGKKKLIEVKYTDDLDKNVQEFSARFEAANEYAKNHNMIFEIFTEKEISPIKLQNFIFLYSFASIQLTKKEIDIITKIVQSVGIISVVDLLSELSISRYEQAKQLPLIWKMMFDGKLKTDFKSSELTMNSIVKKGI